MLKLSIPVSIFNAVSASLVSIGHAIVTTEKTHPKLKAILHKQAVTSAGYREMSVEDYLKEKEERSTKSFMSFIKKFDLTNIIEHDTKVFKVAKTNEALEISINDEYLIECIEICTRSSIKMIKPFADMAVILEEDLEYSEAFNSKWFPSEVKDDLVVETEVKQTEETPAKDTLYHGWKLSAAQYSTPEPFYTTEDQESWILIHGLDAVRDSDNKELYVDRIDVRSVMNMKEGTDMQEFAKEVKLPISLIKGIQRYFEYDTVLNHTSTANPKADS